MMYHKPSENDVFSSGIYFCALSGASGAVYSAAFTATGDINDSISNRRIIFLMLSPVFVGPNPKGR
jgi:hypothetical protein